MLQPYKPDSVTSHRKAFYHLSSPAVTHRIQLPTPSGKLLRATREIQIDLPEYIWHFNSQGLPQNTLLYFSVCSYHTFSPLSRHQDETASFLWHYSVLPPFIEKKETKTHPLGGAMLYVVRIFLSSIQSNGTAIEQTAAFYLYIVDFYYIFTSKINPWTSDAFTYYPVF